MKNSQGVLGIVLARGGSKGIPRKNIMPLKGTPLIAWTLRAAVKSGVFDRLIVSTDAADIADCARRFGGEVPFVRPAFLSTDKSSSIDCVIHALEYLKDKDNFNPEYVFLLQPTSPFRSVEDICTSVNFLKSSKGKKFDALVSVSSVDKHPLLMYALANDGKIFKILPGRKENLRRQDLPEVYALNGAIYICRTSVLLKRKTFYPPKTYGFVMPYERSVDIDLPMDMLWAEFLIKQGLVGR